MPVSYMYLNTALVFSLMWAIRTLELGLFATLKSNMSHHILLVSITLPTCHTLKILLSAMMGHLPILHNYWHEWDMHINIRSSKLPCHTNTSGMSVRMLINVTAGLLEIQVLFEFYCTMMVKLTSFKFCNRRV